MRLETRCKRRDGRARGSRPRVHDDVEPWHFPLIVAEPLAQQALESISLHRVARGAHADREAQPRVIEMILTRDHEEIRIARSSAPGVNGVELRFVGETTAARKSVRSRSAGSSCSRGRQTARRLRPLARRRLRTRRPPLVAMRARKP